MQKPDYWDTYFPQFTRLNDSAISRLMSSAKVVEMSAGQQVFFAGNSCDNYLLMLEGKVKVRLIAETGREILLYHVCSGDSCVLTTSCLLSGDSYPAEGIIEQDATAFVIASKDFHLCLEGSETFRRFVFSNFSLRLSNIIQRMEEVVFTPIEAKLAKYLLESNDTVIKITHHEIASELGSVREVVSRHLKRFEVNGWVALNRGSIEIKDAQQLRDIYVQYSVVSVTK